jgi:hypothetical protein
MRQDELDVLRVLYTQMLKRGNSKILPCDFVVIGRKTYFKARRKPWLILGVSRRRFFETARKLKKRGYIDFEIFQGNIVYRFLKKYFEEFKTN